LSVNPTSDPFVTAFYCGRKIGTTRVRPRTLNPQWDNETFVVPVVENFEAPYKMASSQQDLFRLEVYDFDWISANDFLGMFHYLIVFNTAY
jgi:Ca2+-dependent lipid-binding protein